MNDVQDIYIYIYIGVHIYIFERIPPYLTISDCMNTIGRMTLCVVMGRFRGNVLAIAAGTMRTSEAEQRLLALLTAIIHYAVSQAQRWLLQGHTQNMNEMNDMEDMN